MENAELYRQLNRILSMKGRGGAVTERLLYDRKHAAEQLSISVRTLDRLLAEGKFNTHRIGKKRLIPRGELVRFARADHFWMRRANRTNPAIE